MRGGLAIRKDPGFRAEPVIGQRFAPTRWRSIQATSAIATIDIRHSSAARLFCGAGSAVGLGRTLAAKRGGAERRDGARCLRGTVACAYARLDALEASNVPCDRDVSPLGAPPRHFSRRTACRQRHEAFVRGTRQRPRRWSRTTAAGNRSRLRLQDRLRKTPLDEPGCDMTNIL